MGAVNTLIPRRFTALPTNNFGRRCRDWLHSRELRELMASPEETATHRDEVLQHLRMMEQASRMPIGSELVSLQPIIPTTDENADHRDGASPKGSSERSLSTA
jgi:hypothetical protein